MPDQCRKFFFPEQLILATSPPRRQKNFGQCTILGVQKFFGHTKIFRKHHKIDIISRKIDRICPIYFYNNPILPDCEANIAQLALFAQQTGVIIKRDFIALTTFLAF